MITIIFLIFFKIACIVGILVIFFAYVGFPFCLTLISRLYRKFDSGITAPNIEELPAIQVVVSCHNEANIIEKRIANILQQAYPRDKLSVLVISDGSSDGSDEIVRKVSEKDRMVNLFTTGTNLGKNNAINLALKSHAFKGSLLCFTDADAEFEPGALVSATRFFLSAKTGLTGGNIAYWLGSGSANLAEGLFWRIENSLREAEGDLGMLVSCTGLFIMMRRELLQPLPAEANTDFAMPLMVLAQGYETKFDKQASVRSNFPANYQEIIKRRKRTIIRALTTMDLYQKNLALHLRIILFWHKTVRFNAFPLQFIILASNIMVLSILTTSFWAGLFVSQCLFYGLALLGWFSERLNLRVPLVHLPYQFTVQNAVAFSAVMSFLRGARISKWIPPR